MRSTEVKTILRSHGLRHWQLADASGVSPYTLSVWLRHDLEGDRLARVQAGLDALIHKEGKQ